MFNFLKKKPKPTLFTFRCSNCDKIHSGVPSFNIVAPAMYYVIPENEIENRTVLTTDTCIIDDIYFFVKGILKIPVEGLDESLSFTPWVSLSESNFKIFQKSLSENDASKYGKMFGWFNSQIDYFGDCINIKTNIHLQDNHFKPLIDMEPTDHPLSSAVNNGISQKELIKIAEYYLHP